MPDLANIVGQDQAITQLQRAMASERMPHAFLFAGPDGVGRKTTAMALAKVLLCSGNAVNKSQGSLLGGEPEAPKGPALTACGVCDDCRMIEASSHPDLHMVYKELAQFHEDAGVRDRVMQELGIDVIRSFLITPAGRLSSRGRGKVFVVLESELMNAASQNALLKTLEEPPPKTTIILVCQSPEEMLPTTLSRCCIVRFRLLPADFVTSKLALTGMPEEEARFWAAFTEGSLGRAIELSAQGMHSIKCDIIIRLAGLVAGTNPDMGDFLAKTMDQLAEQEIASARKADGSSLSKNLASRKAAGTMLQLIASAFHDAMVLSTNASLPLVHSDQRPAVESLARRFAPTQLAEIIEQLSEYEQLLWRNVNPKTVWDNVAITCASAAPLNL